MINKTFRAFLIAAAFAGLVSSCSNLESGPMGQPVFLGGQGQVKMAVLSGSIGFGGAMPRGLSQSLAASDLSFTAFPGIPSGDSIVYTIWAELSSDSSVKYPAVVADDKKSYTVSIPIGDEEKTYVIKGEVKSGETLLCSGTTETFPISQSAPVAAKNLVLGGAASFSGKGEIALEILIDSATGIDSCAATCEGANIGEDSYAVSDGKVTVAVAEIDSGSRLVDFAFYKGASLLYQFSELVNVFDAMKTDTWVQNGVGGDPWLETTTDAGTGAKTTVCKVTQALVQSFALTEFYVDSTRQNTNPAGSDYTKGSGTAQNPCVSLSDAIAYMRDTATDYTIYIIGTLEGAQLIPTYLKKEKNEGDDPSYKYAKSLTLCGASGYSGGEPVSAIDAKSTDTGDKQTALTLHSLVPVTIKDLKITGGWYDGNSIGGGGIYMKENTTLTLSSGALVMGNRSKGSGGGGIYIDEGAALTIEDGAVIKDNHEVSASSNTGGGAIFNYSGTVTMKGGIIANNTAVHDGGAIYCDNGSFTMEGGVIGDDNTSETATLEDDKHSNYAAGKGGAIFLGSTFSDSSSMSMTGGTIVYNAAAGSGGGIYVAGAAATICGSMDYNYSGAKGGAVYTTTGGEVGLDGAGMSENKAATNGGAIYVDAVGGASATLTVKGAVKIPCKGKNYNDVYLHRATAKARVKVMEPLSTYGIALTITPASYVEDLQYVDKDASVSWFDAVEKLGVLPEFNADGTVSKRWCFRFDEDTGAISAVFGDSSDTTYAQGDIVFCDGTNAAYSDSANFTQSQLAGAVAYIFYKGSALSDNSATRSLGIGFAKPEKLVWCSEDAAAKGVAVSDISCVNTNMHSGTDSFVAGSVKNGSRNLEKISAAITAALGDDADDTNEPEKYPAFYYGINYKDRMVGEETISRFTSGSTLANNWYLPSAAELEKIRTTLTNINKVTVLCGGDKIDLNSDVHLWCLSSSTNADGTEVIVEDFIKAYATGDRYVESSKTYTGRLVFAIREF